MFKPRDFHGSAQLGAENSEYFYRTQDRLADVLAEGYFSPLNVARRLYQTTSYELGVKVGDWIRVNAGDAYSLLVVVGSEDDVVTVAEVFSRKSPGRLTLSKE